jgi:uncharacterized protein
MLGERAAALQMFLRSPEFVETKVLADCSTNRKEEHPFLDVPVCCAEQESMRIGVISDTHDFLDPRVAKLFEGVEHILHGGDIGSPMLLSELQSIAPVAAVLGNTDSDLPGVRETETVTLAGKKFLLHHIIRPGVGSPRVAEKLRAFEPDVLVFGHTHKPFAEQFGPTLYFNPGYAGKQRFDLERSLALMEIKGSEISWRFVKL